tara:strand:- start:276 stop:1001 length:726 start_codon:yes stop_codon:yes gene_type:complete
MKNIITNKIKTFLKNFNWLIDFFSIKMLSKHFFFSIKIKSDKIKYFLELKNTLNRQNFLWNGDWDKKKIEIKKYRKFNVNYNSVFQIYKENVNYKKSDEYLHKSKQIKEGKKISRVKNIHELNNYFLSLDQLKDSLKKNGYLSQIELNYKTKNNKTLKEKYGDDEIGVVIGRKGEIIKLEDKYGGTHRLALCKILKIKNIIVNVKAIHGAFLNSKDLTEILDKKDKKYLKILIKRKLKLIN